MHTEDNKAVVRRFFEDVVNGSDLDRAGEFVTADYIEHQQLPGARGCSRHRDRQALSVDDACRLP